ncbi:hypothetical protein [Alishewanella phage vB_AspM_Slicko01]|nr:hypothetical protein [Alishewanella phage vB_AspM_Slicko01]
MMMDKLYESLLEEGISPIVFHSTKLNGALSILKTDRVMMSRAANSPEEYSLSKKLFFLSTARTKVNMFSSLNATITVTFTLDGRRLSNNFAGDKIDYFGSEANDNPARHLLYEFEDRILSHKPTINNFSKYVLEVSVYIPRQDQKHDVTIEAIHTIKKECEKRNIKFGVYESRLDFMRSSNDTSNRLGSYSTDGTETKLRYGTVPENDYRYETQIAEIEAFVYMLQNAKGKRYRGKVNVMALKQFNQRLADPNFNMDIHITNILNNKVIISSPKIQEQIGFIFKYAKKENKDTYRFVRDSVLLMRNEHNKYAN